MNIVRKNLNILASLLFLAVGTIYLIDAVITSRTMIKLSGGKTLFLFSEDHAGGCAQRESLYSIEELQVKTLAQQLAHMAEAQDMTVLVEEPSQNILKKHTLVTDTKLLAGYCSEDGLLRVVIKDVDFRKRYLNDAFYLFSDKAEHDFSVLCHTVKENIEDTPIKNCVIDLVDLAQKFKDEEECVCEEALHPLFDAALLKQIYTSESPVITVVAGYLHNMKILEAIAQVDFPAWTARETIGKDGQSTIVPLDTKFLSFSPDIKQIQPKSWCALL